MEDFEEYNESEEDIIEENVEQKAEDNFKVNSNVEESKETKNQ